MASYSSGTRLVLPESSLNQPLEQPDYNINELPDSILTEILARLPTCKSAQQCKCICKHWLSLISTPYFIRRFISLHREVSPLQRDSEPVTFLHQYRYFAYHDIEHDVNATVTSHPVHTKVDAVADRSVLQLSTSFELDFLPFCLTVDILASCQDLLVAYDRWNSFELLRQGASFYVCNLVTKEWIALPPSPSNYWRSGLVGFITYEADPCKSKVAEFTRHYKIVHISKAKQFHVEVFSSETGEWSKSMVLPCSSFVVNETCITNAVPFEKKLHWIINKNSILAFDPFDCDNQCRLIDLPTLQEDGRSNETECLGVFEEHLLMSKLARVNGNPRVTIWELKDYNTGEWCLKHSVSLNAMEFDYQVGYGNVIEFDYQVGYGDVACLLAFQPKEKAVLYLRYKNQILACNVQERTMEMICECNRSWTWHLSNERDTVFPLVHPCWPSTVKPSRSVFNITGDLT